MKLRLLAGTGLTFLISALAGCGGGETVTGTVKYEDGAPVEDGSVEFTPVGGADSHVADIHAGNFTLDGMPHGEYLVSVRPGLTSRFARVETTCVVPMVGRTMVIQVEKVDFSLYERHGE